MKTCGTCKYYRDWDQFTHCRRYPPTRVDATNAGYPITVPASGCGEHKLSPVRLVKNAWRRLRRDNNSVS
jgi:hypothetical protein